MVALLIEALGDVATGAVPVTVDRHTLYKRRWRATAADGSELAVNLDVPAEIGAILESADGRRFRVEQEEEEVLVIKLPTRTDLAAKVGWYLGNRHLPVEVREDEILLERLQSLADSLDRIGIPYSFRTDTLRCASHSSHTH